MCEQFTKTPHPHCADFRITANQREKKNEMKWNETKWKPHNCSLSGNLVHLMCSKNKANIYLAFLLLAHERQRKILMSDAPHTHSREGKKSPSHQRVENTIHLPPCALSLSSSRPFAIARTCVYAQMHSIFFFISWWLESFDISISCIHSLSKRAYGAGTSCSAALVFVVDAKNVW